MTDLRAITVRQPWAWAIAHAGKDVENRSSWLGDITGPVLIHAAQQWADDWLDAVDSIAELNELGWRNDDVLEGSTTLGAVVAVATIPKGPVGPHGSHSCTPDRWPHRDAPNPGGPFCCSPWATGGSGAPTVHYPLDEVTPLVHPVPARGALGFWRPNAATVDAVRAQLAAAVQW